MTTCGRFATRSDRDDAFRQHGNMTFVSIREDSPVKARIRGGIPLAHRGPDLVDRQVSIFG